MPERERIRRRRQPHQTQATGGGLWPVVLAAVIVFSVGGFFFLRNVLGNPVTTSSTATLPASSTPGASFDSPSIPRQDSGQAPLRRRVEPVETTPPGQAVPIQGAEHIELGQAHPEYNSDPPTSGWHLASAIPAGFYDKPQIDEALVHNLEHGHIVIAYDCEKLENCDEVKTKLKAIVDRYDGWKVTVVPRQNKDTPLALTAWGRIDKLDDYDEARITAFIDAYRDQGPEKTPK